MDDALQARLRDIERRQRLVIGLLLVPYLVGIGELVGYWVAGVAAAALAVAAFALVAAWRRRDRETAGQ